MNRDILKVVELFSSMSVKVFAEHLHETVGPASQTNKTSKILKLQDKVHQELLEWETLEGPKAEAYYELARDIYHNEEDLQTNVDPITSPWDVNEVYKGGVWVRAWVWVPREAIETRLDIKEKEKDV